MDLDKTAKEVFLAIGAFQAGPIRRVQELSQGEMAMLGYFILCGGEATPTELSHQLQVSTARIANALNSMEKKGYVVRTHDSVDRRKVFVAITEKGKRKANEGMEQAVAGIKELLLALGEEDSLEFLRLMKKVAALIRKSNSADE